MSSCNVCVMLLLAQESLCFILIEVIIQCCRDAIEAFFLQIRFITLVRINNNPSFPLVLKNHHLDTFTEISLMGDCFIELGGPHKQRPSDPWNGDDYQGGPVNEVSINRKMIQSNSECPWQDNSNKVLIAGYGAIVRGSTCKLFDLSL